MSDDPVPHFPPRFGEAPSANLFVGLTVSLLWSRFCQVAGGVQVDPHGVLTEQPLSTPFKPIAGEKLSDWWVGPQGVFDFTHTMKVYRSRWDGVMARPGQGTNDLLPGTPPELSSGATAAAFQEAATKAAELPLPGQEIKTMSVVIPREFRPRVVHANLATWVVYIQDVPVLVCTTQSAAKTQRKWLYKWLRVLMTTDFAVFQTGVGTALNNFITAAGTPGSGFRPTLNLN